MPIISSGSKVLVTGANGYIAVWVVRGLLERGHSVRGVVRSEEKGRFLLESFKSYGSKLEIVVIEDITKTGVFDEALKGIDAIEHIASPFHLKADDPQEIIDPAVKGTISILESAVKYSSTIKRVILTSSCAAVLQDSDKPQIFTEADWNERCLREVTEKGRDSSVVDKYYASKTLSERAAWEFYEKVKGKVGWDMTVLNPPFVFGPLIHEASGVDTLNTSSYLFWNTTLVEGSQPEEALLTQGGGWIDVRDIAEAHIRSLEREAAGGERIVVCGGSYIWQDWIDVANSLSPSPIPSHKLARGSTATKPPVEQHPFRYNVEKADRILGIKYRTMEQVAQDTLADFYARGW